jgi:hypothetical protein
MTEDRDCAYGDRIYDASAAASIEVNIKRRKINFNFNLPDRSLLYRSMGSWEHVHLHQYPLIPSNTSSRTLAHRMAPCKASTN